MEYAVGRYVARFEGQGSPGALMLPVLAQIVELPKEGRPQLLVRLPSKPAAPVRWHPATVVSVFSNADVANLNFSRATGVYELAQSLSYLDDFDVIKATAQGIIDNIFS